VTLTIIGESTATTDEWQRAWKACDSATFFQSPEWAQVWAEYTDGSVQAAPKVLRFSDGKSVVLPLCYQRKWRGLLDRYVASPEATYGGWLTPEPLTPAHAVLVTRWLLDAEGLSLVWRLNPYDPVALEAAAICEVRARLDWTHSVRLNASPEELFNSWRKGTREDIRKAQKRCNVEVRPATTINDWTAYFGVYQDSLRRWGRHPDDGYRWELFNVLRRRQSSDITLWVARVDGQVASGELSFYSRRHAVSWHAATRQQYLRSGVSKYQTFEILKDCCARGLEWLDFNPSAELAGVKALKESFRAQALPAPIVYVDAPVKRMIRRCAVLLNVRDAKLRLHPIATMLDSSVPLGSPRTGAGAAD
jgi:CelD/BcsL family acetyltransferase involved in cellulose biosynthesis